LASIYFSLFCILVVATLAPFVASLVPGRAVPEVVFLVFGGALLGKYGVLRGIDPDLEPIQLLGDLGMGFLFLKAGYEIDARDLLGRTGAIATGSWLVSLALGFAVVSLFSSRLGFGQSSWVALAICMTTTAYGTLAPIISDRKLMGTRVGRAVSVYGSLGEILPVLAMAFLLSSRSVKRTGVLLVSFVLVCVAVYLITSRARNAGARFWRFLVENAGSSSQPLMRVVSLLLVFLLLATVVFQFDAALGAFASGFILRALFPEGSEALEGKIDVLSNGFFQPVFFVVSGASLDLAAATRDLPLLFGFILALIVVRGLVVAVSLRVDPGTRAMSWREVFSTSAYCTMALPLIVAITGIAQDNGVLSATAASVLVTSAALTVLVIPVVTSFVRVVDEVDPVEAAHELAHHEAPLEEVMREHMTTFHERQSRFHRERSAIHRQGRRFSSAEYFARMEGEATDGVPDGGEVEGAPRRSRGRRRS
jgi:Kef-type K+ transport system membrane component KefB